MSYSPSFLGYIFLLVFVFPGPGVTQAEEANSIGNFSQGDLSGWEEKSFEGNSQYGFIETDMGRVLRASTEGKP